MRKEMQIHILLHRPYLSLRCWSFTLCFSFICFQQFLFNLGPFTQTSKDIKRYKIMEEKVIFYPIFGLNLGALILRHQRIWETIGAGSMLFLTSSSSSSSLTLSLSISSSPLSPSPSSSSIGLWRRNLFPIERNFARSEVEGESKGLGHVHLLPPTARKNGKSIFSEKSFPVFLQHCQLYFSKATEGISHRLT